jgi:hypothetical protein
MSTEVKMRGPVDIVLHYAATARHFDTGPLRRAG